MPDDPDQQVAGTIQLMRQYVIEDAHSPDVARCANEALAGAGLDAAAMGNAGAITDLGKCAAVFRYVKSKLRFVEDDALTNGAKGFGHFDSSAPVVEALIRPADMAVMCEDGGCQRVGDCDDFSMYTAALLRALDIRCSFVTVAADEAHPGYFSHVYVAAYTRDGQRVALDCSHGPHLGWETEQATRLKEWTIGGPDATSLVLAGLLAYAVARATGVL